jgi:hypothetical protein
VTFPINSTSVMTPACERVCRVMQRVAREGLISYGGVFSCRKIAGTNYWSQHAWGNALDLFPKDSKYNDEIARAAVTRLRSGPSPTAGANWISPTSSIT